MINLKAFEEAHKKYKPSEMPFLTKHKEEVLNKQPYKKLKILQNIPLTIEAVLKIEPLVLGGADITISCIKNLPPDQKAVEILNNANIKVQIEHNFENNFDICLDCCGELANLIRPKYGAAELTKTGSDVYKKTLIDYPLICVDDSKLKYLETLYGTGDGFIRALHSLTNTEIYNKKFLVFGYGKVGKGIINSLLKFTDDIIVIEKDKTLLAQILKKGLKTIDYNDQDKIKNELLNTYCIVTATGIKNIISDFFQLTSKDLKDILLANMGAEDEFGQNFTEKDVLFNKKPLNFSLSEPTTMKYLDPILYAHNISIDLILSKKVLPGYNAFPDDLATSILKQWSIMHREDTQEITGRK